MVVEEPMTTPSLIVTVGLAAGAADARLDDSRRTAATKAEENMIEVIDGAVPMP